MNMTNFGIGHLFDLFVSCSGCLHWSGACHPPPPAAPLSIWTRLTQVVKQADIGSGSQKVAIRCTLTDNTTSFVEFFINDKLFARVDKVGVPRDKQGQSDTGINASVGVTPGVTARAPGEVLGSQINSFSIGHGLFSLLDAFPFQHPQRPDLSANIPVSERLFAGCQGHI